jgi:SAM-dependent methyltransferase
MNSTGAASVRCPDCATSHGPLAKGDRCAGCHREFELYAGVWDLLPTRLAAEKRNEDRLHEEPRVTAWRRLVQKAYWVDALETRWLPRLITPATRRFLEIGGGLCYASALAKGRLPDGYVVATDVSGRYLRRDAVRVGEIIGSPADLYAAADAEALPFDDGQFDAVYAQIVLYRVPDPVRALREIHRVLAPGGRFIGVERASPSLSLHPDNRQLAERARRDGTAERPVTFSGWRRWLRAAGLDTGALTFVPGRRIAAGWLRRAGNAVRPMHVAIDVRK